MKTRHSLVCRGLLFPCLMLWAGPALAVIRVDVPLEQVYGSARQPLVAKVASIDAGRRVATLSEVIGLDELSTHLQEKDRAVSLGLSGDASLASRLQPGAPAVVFVGRRGGAVHAADALFEAAARDGAERQVDRCKSLLSHGFGLLSRPCSQSIYCERAPKTQGHRPFLPVAGSRAGVLLQKSDARLRLPHRFQ